MYDMISCKCYWRSLYVDVGNVVRNCESCTEKSYSMDDPKCSDGSDREIGSGTALKLAQDRVSSVWKKVQVQVFGPFSKTPNNNEYLITIADPHSCWIQAKPSPASKFNLVGINFDSINIFVISVNLEYICSNFIFETFCTFGFAQCQVSACLK